MISINLEQIFMLQVARDIGGLMDNKSIFKDIGERESNLCQGSPPDPVLSLYAPGWRSNRLCVIKWWWWLYLTFVKGGAPDFSRSVLSASVQWINPQTEWDRVKMLFLGVNTGVILRWMKGMCLQSLCVISSLRPCVCALTYFPHVLPAPWKRCLEVNFIFMEIPKGTLRQEIHPRCSLREKRDRQQTRRQWNVTS